MADLLGPADAPFAVTVRPTDTRTFGGSDSWFKDCSTPTADDGTDIQAAWLNAILAQVRRAIRGSGITENNADDDMLLKAIQQLNRNTQRSQVRADRGATSQTITSGVSTRVTAFGSSNVALLGGSTFSGGVLTIGAQDAGLWFVSANARQLISAASGFAASININGSTTPVATDGATTTTSGIVHAAAARLLNLVAGDTVEMQLVQTSGSSVTFNDIYCLSAVRLGAS